MSIDPESSYYDLTINQIARTHWLWVEKMRWHNKGSPLESLALITSEVGEAVNECRGETPTDNFAEELVDIILRTADLAYTHNIDISAAILVKMEKNISRGTRGRIK